MIILTHDDIVENKVVICFTIRNSSAIMSVLIKQGDYLCITYRL